MKGKERVSATGGLYSPVRRAPTSAQLQGTPNYQVLGGWKAGAGRRLSSVKSPSTKPPLHPTTKSSATRTAARGEPHTGAGLPSPPGHRQPFGGRGGG